MIGLAATTVSDAGWSSDNPKSATAVIDAVWSGGNQKGATAVSDAVWSSDNPKSATAVIDAVWSDGSQKAVTGAGDLPDNYTHWLAKFPTGKRPEQQAEVRAEYIYHLLALEAGINMAPCHLLELAQGAACFLTRRFDRLPGNRRRHIHSLAGLMHADFRLPDFDYIELMKLTAQLTLSHKDKLQQYRRMVFNLLSGNRDDHTKNFAFMLDDQRQWMLTPAYDLTFSHGIAGEHSMSVAGKGREVSESHLLAVAEAGSISAKQAREIISEVAGAMRRWDELARNLDIPASLRQEITAYHQQAYRSMQ